MHSASDTLQEPVQLIVCDLGDTLVEEADPDWTAFASEVRSLPNGTALLEAAAGLIGPLREESERPAVSQKPSRQIIAEYLAADPARPTLETLIEGAWRLLGGEDTSYLAPRPGAMELLETATARGVPVVALSNTALPATLVDRVLTKHGLKKHLSRTVYSSEAGWKKPAPQVFELAQSGTESADSVVMVGNSWDADIAPALERQWKAVWVQADDGGPLLAGDYRRLTRVPDLHAAIDAIWGEGHA